MNWRKSLGALAAVIVLLGGCASGGSRIGSSPLFCCPGDYASYSEYSLKTEGLPLFLRGYVMTQFQRAFDEKGLARNDQVHDIEVMLKYNHINLSPQQQEIDPFIRIESLNVELNYVAQIQIEINETATGERVWAGVISRIHQVTPGEYMHEECAKPAFCEAFKQVLSNYPAAGVSLQL